MPISQRTEVWPCWYVAYPGSDDDGGDSHYVTEAEARKAAASVREDDPLLAVDVGQFAASCWTVTCDGPCGEPLVDGEREWTLHLSSRTEAEWAAADYEWTVTADGVAYCESDVPAGAQAVVVEQVPGQLTLTGEEPDDGR